MSNISSLGAARTFDSFKLLCQWAVLFYADWFIMSSITTYGLVRLNAIVFFNLQTKQFQFCIVRLTLLLLDDAPLHRMRPGRASKVNHSIGPLRVH